jgi:hypothetical protein
MGTHQARTSLVVKATVDARTGRRQRVSLGWHEIEVVTLTRTDNSRPHISPQQYAVIGRLSSAAGIERGSVQHDALLRVSQQHSGGPLAD